MVELADIFREYGPAYRAKYGQRMLPSHLRAMWAIEHCRTQTLGGQVYACQACEESFYSYHSCRNRHCPKCQTDAAEEWLSRQQTLRLPVPHFMVTFTLPAALRGVASGHQKLVYDLLFRASAAALQELAQDPRFVGGRIGMVGVIHTWARDLSFHPHVHYLVPGGGVSTAGQHWLSARNRFLVHVKPLSILFRAKFRDALKRTALFSQVPSAVWEQDWVVHSQVVGDGARAFEYLARYIFRVALSNSSLVKVEAGQVTFRYRPSGSTQTKACTWPAFEFIRRFLQHVLPKGFVKVRYYGLFSPAYRAQLARLRLQLIRQARATIMPIRSESQATPGPATTQITCPKCRRPMMVVDKLPPQPHPRPP